MEYPDSPSQPFRLATLAPALITLLVIVAIQPLLAITATVMPFAFNEPPWRLRFFELLLATAPQIAVSFVLIAAIGLVAERYGAVRGAAIAMAIQGLLLIPILLLYYLDVVEARRLVPLDQMRRYQITAMQNGFSTTALIPVLLWIGRRGLQAGKRPAAVDVSDVLLIDKEPLPGPLDPRVTN